VARKKPVSIKAARKKKQIPTKRVAYAKPEGDDWKPLGWDQLWKMLYQEALPFALEYVQTHQHAA
jgi:hypothetical protein